MKMIKAQLSGDKVFSNSQEAFSLNERSLFGEKKHETIEYNLIEALFLLENKKLEVHNKNNKLSLHDLLKRAKKHDKRIDIKLSAFSDLRKRGYIVKTALKFGTEFRVYNKGTKPGKEHAPWLLYPVKESESHNWYDFVAKSRIATSTKKKLMLGIVDEESDVTYYEISWLRV
jgi:tRNA-intron endonuclease